MAEIPLYLVCDLLRRHGRNDDLIAASSNSLAGGVDRRPQGTLAALLSHALPSEFRDAAVPSPVDPESHVLDVFVERFLLHLGNYLRHGRLKKYRREHVTSASPRGRIDIAQSTRLLGRGKRGRLISERDTLTADLLVNRLLALGIRAAESFLVGRQGGTDLLAQSRTYAPLFADVDWYTLERSSWSAKATAFETAMIDPRFGEPIKSAVAYSRALVLHLGAWPEGVTDYEIPHAFFLNLETLFEDAVRQSLADVVGPDKTAKGSALKQGLFMGLSDRYLADPDVVVGSAKVAQLLVDAKYKDLDRWPAHSDVYQIVAHASAFDCKTAVLVHPGDRKETKTLGVAKSGVTVLYSTVRVHHLTADLSSVLDDVGYKHMSSVGVV